ncbi:uroporphyrinogen-III synthase [Neotabrizicola shimadae]|uniref:Uroporphyrinogen-III synthase n=1 Tax=Neotabrizicola shimadae TaxID=2807096 RepID=A0A8G0ZVY7_9RHOB|nr:uroporphyrinogen-III synthase [Neotabrizicola shimadae]QYZ69862.1 uroporphyrinogen-III synthase [Neotabrizicola shimadae]
MARQSRHALPLPVLVTRPEPQASRFAADFRARLGDSVRVVLSPLMAPVFLSPPLPMAKALVLTSESAVQALPGLSGPLPRRAFCVGGRTAEAAHAAGLEAMSAEGDAAALAALILSASPEGPLLWLRGEDTAGDLAGTLARAGVRLEQAVVYRQDPQPLSPTAQALLRGPDPVIVPLFSPRTAGLFAEAAIGGTAPLHLCSMSAAVDRAASDLAVRSRTIAARPTGEALLADVEKTIRALLSA